MAASETCSRCGEEVRWGKRGTFTGYLHRLDADHVPLFGAAQTAEDHAEHERQLDLPRERLTKDGDVEIYTTREHDIIKDPDAARRKLRLALARGLDPDAPPPPPPAPEISQHDLEPDSFPPRSGIRQVINLVLKTDGWELRRLTGARGPYMRADGTVGSISDSVVLGARGPRLDVGVAIAVASWRDGKFDTAYAGRLDGGIVRVDPVNATQLKSWIKEPA